MGREATSCDVRGGPHIRVVVRVLLGPPTSTPYRPDADEIGWIVRNAEVMATLVPFTSLCTASLRPGGTMTRSGALASSWVLLRGVSCSRGSGLGQKRASHRSWFQRHVLAVAGAQWG